MTKNIIFDMGNVIIDIDIPKTFEAFAALANIPVQKATDFFQTKGYYNAFEIGNIKEEEFRASIRKDFGAHLTDDVIDKAWCSLLLAMPVERLDRIKELKSNYRIFLLSNTNSIHIKEVCRRASLTGHDFLALFDIPFVSYEMKLMKPDIKIYQQVLQQANIQAEESVFIDDNETNIQVAASVGIQTIHLDPLGSLLNKLSGY
ncbi:MAG: HAD family phosphatase [Agriterribacter sp.]